MVFVCAFRVGVYDFKVGLLKDFNLSYKNNNR
jgi:hypothetical protein